MLYFDFSDNMLLDDYIIFQNMVNFGLEFSSSLPHLLKAMIRVIIVLLKVKFFV